MIRQHVWHHSRRRNSHGLASHWGRGGHQQRREEAWTTCCCSGDGQLNFPCQQTRPRLRRQGSGTSEGCRARKRSERVQCGSQNHAAEAMETGDVRGRRAAVEAKRTKEDGADDRWEARVSQHRLGFLDEKEQTAAATWLLTRGTFQLRAISPCFLPKPARLSSSLSRKEARCRQFRGEGCRSLPRCH